MSKSFKEWLKTSQYTKIDTVRDDMIRDILQDVTFPDSSDETSLVTYMESRLHKLGRHSLLPNFKAIYASYLILYMLTAITNNSARRKDIFVL